MISTLRVPLLGPPPVEDMLERTEHSLADQPHGKQEQTRDQPSHGTNGTSAGTYVPLAGALPYDNLAPGITSLRVRRRR